MASRVEPETSVRSGGFFEPPPWGWGDLLALLVWTAAIAAFFWDAVSFRGALFYFDITEINYPYRAFFAEELRSGRFSRWCPGLYCGLPLYSESQAGYLHPLKYLLYPWMPAGQAFNLDTVLSIWLTGVGTYLWLRRHVGAAGALTGAAIVGTSGYVWAHLIHTSMINALASVPFVIWGLEVSWASGRWRGAVLGGLALAFQVFAGHLQDTLLTIGLVGVYALYRVATEQTLRARLGAAGMAAALVGVGIMLSAVQWIPSKELLDRSPRAGGLARGLLIYGSWSPELLPTAVIREAYGTRARDTDWMDGYYPYHEMNTYMGLIAIVLAVIGAGGASARDRWSSFWVGLVGLGAVLMLGGFTCLFDFAHRVPVLGSSREPVRFHLWVSLGVAALAAVGVERISRPGTVSLRGGLILAGVLVALSIPIMIYVYSPAWTDPRVLAASEHRTRFGWLVRELSVAVIRTAVLASFAWWVASMAARTTSPTRRARCAAVLPLLVIADLLGAHAADVPTVDPRYWTEPPETARRLKSDPGLIRIFCLADKSAGEPGYASRPIDFLSVRDTLDWSLGPVWHLASARGETPMIASRVLDYTNNVVPGKGRLDIESVSHVVTGRRYKDRILRAPAAPVGTAFITQNAGVMPRARLAGLPVYADDQRAATAALQRLTAEAKLRDHLVVEDPDRPLPADATVSGTARIVEDLPERVVIDVDAATPAYLFLADTFDPGWSATVDGQPAPVRPAYVAFRAVFLSAGKHTVVFTYRPAGFDLGLELSCAGILIALLLGFWPLGPIAFAPDHATLGWPPRWRTWWFLFLGAIVLFSAVGFGTGGRPIVSTRWKYGVHHFRWDAKIDAMGQKPQ
jgi:hypothetical protein